MHDWQTFLIENGACTTANVAFAVTDFGHILDMEEMRTGFVAPLSDLGLIRLSGDDADQFLHNQITNDVKNMRHAEARLAGYCSPKGRLLATFLMWKNDESIFLQLPRELQAALQKRLQMFVMRAKVKLTDVSDEFVCLGLGGQAAAGALAPWFATLPAEPYAKQDHDALGSLIRVADAFGHARYVWITNIATAKKIWPTLCKTLKPAGTSTWQLANIHAGVPQITLPTQEKFVPQMINFEIIGGVSFKKGCYPGQEIVARSQYLGKQKRRMMAAFIKSQEVTAGMEVVCSSDPDQPCGMIVNAQARAEGSDCLVEIKIAAIKDSQVHLGSLHGAVLHFFPLPYALPADNT